MISRRALALVTSLTLVTATAAGGCGDDQDSATDPTTGPTVATSTPSPDGDGGWIGGEPEWDDASSGVGGSDGRDMAATDDAFVSGGEPVAAPVGETAEHTVPDDAPQPDAPLRAGSVDDNADFAAYLAYLARLDEAGVQTRPFDPRGRVVVTVTDAASRAVAGVPVAVSAGGQPLATVRTTADGTARFLPNLYTAGDAATFEFSAPGAAAVVAGRDTVAALTLDATAAARAPIAVDVLFLLDATGSMGDEIGRLKETIDSVAARVDALDSQPDVRFAMTLYRDLHDSFVTSTFDFTSDVDGFRAALADVVANGGDDYPEALDEGLAEALTKPAWRDPATTTQLIFLVADAPPQVARQVDTPYPAAVVDAVGRGITIVPIASSESDDQAEAVFRQLAQATGGRFVFLSYGAGGAATGEHTDIDTTDYEEMALDDLVVRLISEELAHFAADGAPPSTDPTTTVTPTPTPPTNPPGQ